jgi:hypothetical protein
MKSGNESAALLIRKSLVRAQVGEPIYNVGLGGFRGLALLRNSAFAPQNFAAQQVALLSAKKAKQD